MPKLPLIGGYSQGRNGIVNSHLCENLMPKFDSENGKEAWYWVPSPGSGNPLQSSPGRIHGMHLFHADSYLYTVAGTSTAHSLYRSVENKVGDLNDTNTNYVFASSTTQVALVGGSSHIWVYDGPDATFHDITKWAEELTVTSIAKTSGTTYTVTVSDTLTPDIIADGDKVYIKGELAGWNAEYTVASLNESAKTFTVTQTGKLEVGTSLTATSAYVLHKSFGKLYTTVEITGIANSGGDTYTVTSSDDLIADIIATGDTVAIRGTTNFNESFTVGTVTAASDTFTITKTGSPADETGAFTAYIEHTISGVTGIKPTHIEYMDSYFIINNTVTNEVLDINDNDFYVSFPGDARIWQQANSGAAQRFSDPLVAIKSTGGDLYLFGKTNLEIFYNSGEGTQPFVPSRNLALPYGTRAIYSHAEVDGALYWISTQPGGGDSVCRVKDYSVEKVSTPAVDYLLEQAGTQIVSTYGAAYSHYGDACYLITNNTNTGFQTLVFDATTSRRSGAMVWSKWTQGALGAENAIGRVAGGNAFSDFGTGNVRLFAPTTYTWGTGTAGTQAITRTGISGAVHLDDKAVFHKRVFIDMENPAGTGYINLSWSDDGGSSYTTPTSLLFTPANTRVEKFGLGRARTSRIYKIQTTAALPITILGAYADMEEGTY